MTEETQTPKITPSQAPATAAALRDKRSLPEGVVPRQAQGYVIAGLAVMILLAVMFSKNHAKQTPAPLPNTAPISNNANAHKIAEFEQNLNDEQLQQSQQQKSSTANPITANATPSQSGAAPGGQPAPAPEPQRDPVADAERELSFKARFASNLVPTTSGVTAHASNLPANSATASEDRSVKPSSQAAANSRSPEVNINSAHGQPYVIFEGTTIDTVLTNRLDGEFAGPVKVMVTNPVYSRDGQHVLVPEGTFLLGEVQKVSSFGQQRLAVAFHRMLMPDGYSVDLNQFHGLDQIGDTGLRDQINHHYLQIFGASMALGVIAGATESSTYGGYNQSGSDMYRQGVASSLSQSSSSVLDRFINVLPTITIREGHRIKIYLTQDLLLPAYENHTMPGVM